MECERVDSFSPAIFPGHTSPVVCKEILLQERESTGRARCIPLQYTISPSTIVAIYMEEGKEEEENAKKVLYRTARSLLLLYPCMQT